MRKQSAVRSTLQRLVSLISLCALISIGFASSQPQLWLDYGPGKLGQLEYEKPEKEPRPDSPGEATLFRREQQKDEHGQVPPDGLVKAKEHVERMQAQQALAAAIERNGWTEIGPGNIGGRTRSIVIHPTNPSTMWLGSIAGGIWKTTNGGASWQPLDDFMANLAVATLVIDPANPNILYAGTGEGFYNTDTIQGAGVFKTTDGGTTWAQLASTANSDWRHVNRLAIPPGISSTLLAAAGSGTCRVTRARVCFAVLPSGRG